MTWQTAGDTDTHNTTSSRHQEHPSVAQSSVEEGHLGHGEDDGAVGQGLSEQQTKVSFVVNRSKSFIDTSSDYGVDTRECGVEDDHHNSVTSLGSVTLVI